MAILMCHRRTCMPLPPQQSSPGPEPQIYYLSTDELFSSGEANSQMDEPNPDPNEISTQMEVCNNEISVEAEHLNEVGSTVTTSSTHSNGNDSFKIRTWDTEAGKFDFKIVRVRNENGTIKRCMQCLICSRVVRTVGMARVKSHRYSHTLSYQTKTIFSSLFLLTFNVTIVNILFSLSFRFKQVFVSFQKCLFSKDARYSHDNTIRKGCQQR